MPDVFDRSAQKNSSPVSGDPDDYSSVMREYGIGRNPLGSFMPKPKNISFEVQHDDEPILLLLRPHPIVNVGWILLTILLFLAPFALPFVPILDFFPIAYQRIAVLAWYLLLFGYALERFLMWFFDVYIITEERIIDVDFYSLVFKKMSEAKISHIQDITSTRDGVMQSLVDYGDVLVQTAAEIPEIRLEDVPKPDEVNKFLSELVKHEESEKE
jgi:hypothetical protein